MMNSIAEIDVNGASLAVHRFRAGCAPASVCMRCLVAGAEVCFCFYNKACRDPFLCSGKKYFPQQVFGQEFDIGI